MNETWQYDDPETTSCECNKSQTVLTSPATRWLSRKAHRPKQSYFKRFKLKSKKRKGVVEEVWRDTTTVGYLLA